MKSIRKQLLFAMSLMAPFAMTGCSGGSNSGGATDGPGPSINVIGLLNNSKLISFNARRPGSTRTISVSGLPDGHDLLGIDFRYAPDSGGNRGLYGLARVDGSFFQLYRISISGDTATLTAVGRPFYSTLDGGELGAGAGGVGFDFNPQVPSPSNASVRVDRIRLVSFNGTNLRLLPNTGVQVDGDPATPGLQPDGVLAYDSTDPRSGTTPRVVSVAYTNNVATAAPSGTINYAIDVATGNLVTQGRPDRDGDGPDTAVSPNTGRLFTVGPLGVALGDHASLDIGPEGSNTALLAFGVNLSTVSLSTGNATPIGNIKLPLGTTIRGLAIVP